MGVLRPARINQFMCLLLAFAIGFLLAACGGGDGSAAAPSGIPNTPDSAERRPEGPFDCVPNEAEDGWDCEEIE